MNSVKMKVLLVLSILVVLATAAPKPKVLGFRNLYREPAGVVNFNVKITGGEEAEPHSIPHQVYLEMYTETQGFYCGGSLISNNYILTAAHCGVDVVEAHIVLGAHKPQEEEDTQIKAVSTNVTIHKDWQEDGVLNDIGVILLPSPVEFTDAIKAVALPSKSDVDNNFVGATAKVSGWGLTSPISTDLSDVLMNVDVEVIENKVCEEILGTLQDFHLCTSGDGGRGACHGDSGGPLTNENKLIGIISFGLMLCPPGNPSAYTRVTSFLDWIADHTDVVIN